MFLGCLGGQTTKHQQQEKQQPLLVGLVSTQEAARKSECLRQENPGSPAPQNGPGPLGCFKAFGFGGFENIRILGVEKIAEDEVTL